MLTHEQAKHIIINWFKHWNENNTADYIDLYSLDARLVSNFAMGVVSESNGKIEGRDTLKVYWQTIHQKHSHLKFDLEKYEINKNQITVYYSSQDKTYTITSTLTINAEGKIEKLENHYSK